MKVCLNTHYPLRSISGASKVVAQLALGLNEHGIDSFVISSRLRDELEPTPEIKAYEIDVSKRKHLRDIYLARRTFSILFKHRKEYDIIHSHSPHLSPMMAALAGKLFRKKVVTTIHGVFPKPGNLALVAFFGLTTKLTFLLSDVVTFVNEEARDHYRIPSGIVIENGIDTEYFSPDSNLRKETRQKLGISDNEILILYVGRLSRDKGVFELLDAFSRIRNRASESLKLLLVGEGEIPAIQEKVKELGIEGNVILTGPQASVKSYYCAADIFVLYSMREGLPMVLLEAASCGLAIISTGVGGIPLLIKDNENGILLEYGDKDVLADKLLSLVEDEKLRQELGTNVRNSIIEGYIINKTIDRYVALYEKLITGK